MLSFLFCPEIICQIFPEGNGMKCLCSYVVGNKYFSEYILIFLFTCFSLAEVSADTIDVDTQLKANADGQQILRNLVEGHAAWNTKILAGTSVQITSNVSIWRQKENTGTWDNYSNTISQYIIQFPRRIREKRNIYSDSNEVNTSILNDVYFASIAKKSPDSLWYIEQFSRDRSSGLRLGRPKELELLKDEELFVDIFNVTNIEYIPLRLLFSSSGFVLKEVRESDDRFRIEFSSDMVSPVSEMRLVYGTIFVRRTPFWLIEKIEANLQDLDQKSDEEYTLRLQVNDWKEVGDLTVPLKIAIDYFSNTMPYSRTEITYEEWQFGSFPRERFTLANYNLPEPGDIIDGRGWSLFFVINVIGVVLIVIGVVLRYIARRS